MKNKEFVVRLQKIRQKAANLFNFGDISSSVIPKLSIVCKSDTSVNIDTKSLTIHSASFIRTAKILMDGVAFVY